MLLGISGFILSKSKESRAAEISPEVISEISPPITPYYNVQEISSYITQEAIPPIEEIPQAGVKIPGGVTIPYSAFDKPQPEYSYLPLAVGQAKSIGIQTGVELVTGETYIASDVITNILDPLALANVGLAAIMMEAPASIKSGSSIGGMAGSLGAYMLGAGSIVGFFSFVGAVVGAIAMGLISGGETRAERAVFDIEIELAPLLKTRLENILNSLRPKYELIWKARYTQENFPPYRYQTETDPVLTGQPTKEIEVKILGDPDGTGKYYIETILATAGYYYPQEVIDLSLEQPLLWGLTEDQQQAMVNLHQRDPGSFGPALVQLVAITPSIEEAYRRAFSEAPSYAQILYVYPPYNPWGTIGGAA